MGCFFTSSYCLQPFSCTLCSAGFTKRNNAARHLYRQHGLSRDSNDFYMLIKKNELIEKSPAEKDLEEGVSRWQITRVTSMRDEKGRCGDALACKGWEV